MRLQAVCIAIKKGLSLKLLNKFLINKFSRQLAHPFRVSALPSCCLRRVALGSLVCRSFLHFLEEVEDLFGSRSLVSSIWTFVGRLDEALDEVASSLADASRQGGWFITTHPSGQVEVVRV